MFNIPLVRWSFWSLLILLPTFHPHSLQASLQVKLIQPESDFLLYEPIEIKVQLKNSSSKPIDPEKLARKKDWITLSVTSLKEGAVDATNFKWTPPATVVPPGESKAFQVNITPLFYIRDTGDYRVSAQLNLGDEELASTPIRITITKGNLIWQQRYSMEALPSNPQKNERILVYSLLVHRAAERQLLYVRIVDAVNRHVLCTTAVGNYINYGDPETRVDLMGDLHVLHQSGSRIFTYTHFEPNGKIAEVRYFSDMGSKPKLIATDKRVTTIIGGEEIFRNEAGKFELVPTAPIFKVPDVLSDPKLPSQLEKSK